MKQIKYFYLPSCPYCREANRFLEELFEENPAYRDIEMTRIDESAEADLAAQYDYYYVPCFFVGEKKLHEGASTKEKIEAVLKAALD